MEKTKVCTKCGEELPATAEYFYRARFGKYGLQATCKKCKREVFGDGQKKYREDHKEQYVKWQNEWHKNNEEHEKEYRKHYYENNKDLIKERNKERRRGWDERYNNKNKDRIKGFKHKYKVSERGKLIAVKDAQKRRASAQKTESSFTPKQWAGCKGHFKNTCCYCGKNKKLTQDHLIPLSAGGEYTVNNIVPACPSCNSSKQDRDFFQWYPEQEFYSEDRDGKILKYLNYNKKTKNQQLSLTIQ